MDGEALNKIGRTKRKAGLQEAKKEFYFSHVTFEKPTTHRKRLK